MPAVLLGNEARCSFPPVYNGCRRCAMPSPFPGIDPYLETSAYWRGFHNMLITFIAQALNGVLPAGFAANVEERVYVQPDDRRAFPDVMVRKPRAIPVGVAARG